MKVSFWSKCEADDFFSEGLYHHNDMYGLVSDIPDEHVGFNYIYDDEEYRSSNRSSECVVPSWNTIRTNVIPNADVHEKWIKWNISRKVSGHSRSNLMSV